MKEYLKLLKTLIRLVRRPNECWSYYQKLLSLEKQLLAGGN